MTTQLSRTATPTGQNLGPVDRFFEIAKRGSTLWREIIGGFATFATMSYIVVLNPIILSGAPAAPAFLALASATALVAGLLTILMGLVGRVPIALAAGLGLNAFVAFQMAPVIGYGGAMGAIVIEGLLTLLLVAFGLRERLFNAVPMAIKHGIAVGIGLFLAFIGFIDAGAVKGAEGVPPVSLSFDSWPDVVFVVTLLLAFVLVVRKVRGALIISIVAGTVLAVVIEAFAHLGSAVQNPAGWALNVPTFADKQFLVAPDFSALLQFNVQATFSAGFTLALVFILSLVLADLFDTFGTVVAVGHQANLLDDEGNLPRMKQVFYVDSAAAAVGGLGGVSSNTSYIESTAGVSEGARTGLASVVTGLLFLLAIFLTPLAQLVPSEAAAAVLVVVGVQLLGQVREIEWSDPVLAISAGLAIIVMPFTFSITNGIGAAFVSYVVLKLFTGKAREVHGLMWVLAVAFTAYFALVPIRALLGI